MKITDLTNDSHFIDLDQEEASNVIGGRGYKWAGFKNYRNYFKALLSGYKPGKRVTVEADNTRTVEPVGTGGSVSTNFGKARTIRGPLYY
jgi:hypothetical protein